LICLRELSLECRGGLLVLHGSTLHLDADCAHRINIVLHFNKSIAQHGPLTLALLVPVRQALHGGLELLALAFAGLRGILDLVGQVDILGLERLLYLGQIVVRLSHIVQLNVQLLHLLVKLALQIGHHGLFYERFLF
jgi:hypothetical protein